LRKRKIKGLAQKNSPTLWMALDMTAEGTKASEGNSNVDIHPE